MAVPKRRTSKSRRNSRRGSNSKLTAPTVSTCSHCGAASIPHRVCMACGYYNGRFVIQVKQA